MLPGSFSYYTKGDTGDELDSNIISDADIDVLAWCRSCRVQRDKACTPTACKWSPEFVYGDVLTQTSQGLEVRNPKCLESRFAGKT